MYRRRLKTDRVFRARTYKTTAENARAAPVGLALGIRGVDNRRSEFGLSPPHFFPLCIPSVQNPP